MYRRIQLLLLTLFVYQLLIAPLPQLLCIDFRMGAASPPFLTLVRCHLFDPLAHQCAELTLGFPQHCTCKAWGLELQRLVVASCPRLCFALK